MKPKAAKHMIFIMCLSDELLCYSFHNCSVCYLIFFIFSYCFLSIIQLYFHLVKPGHGNTWEFLSLLIKSHIVKVNLKHLMTIIGMFIFISLVLWWYPLDLCQIYWMMFLQRIV